jgi:transposase
MAGHHDAMAVADVAQAHGAEVTSLGAIGPRHGASDPRLRQRPANAHSLLFVSDAGPWGDWLSRERTPTGHHCWVVAPSLSPTKPGERVTTARRDAVPLARLARSGDLTAGAGPTVEDAALRDLSRARAEAISALKAATGRLTAVWLRHESRDPGRATWGEAHLRWLSAVVCPPSAPPIVVQAYVRAVTEPTDRLGRLEPARHDQGNSWRFHPVVHALQAWRGVQFPVAVTPVAELGDLTRFETPDS